MYDVTFMDYIEKYTDGKVQKRRAYALIYKKFKIEIIMCTQFLTASC